MSRTRLYVGNISRRSRTSDIEYLFSKYGRVIDIDLKHDYGFVEFEDSRDAEDAVYELDGYRLDGVRLVVERARHPRGGYREERRPAPGSGKCYNCGKEGHWARDCSAGDWSNRCYRCGKDGHLERNCTSDVRRSSRSASPHRAVSRSASRGRSHSRSRSSRSRSRSPRNDENATSNNVMTDASVAPPESTPEVAVPAEKQSDLADSAPEPAPEAAAAAAE